jgi:DNA-binding PadR family transcriptional regulator
MLAAGLVNESALDDERRRYYRITPLGQRAVRAEMNRLDGAVSAARLRLAGSKA